MAKKPGGLGRGLSSLFGDMEVDLSVLDPAEIAIDPGETETEIVPPSAKAVVHKDNAKTSTNKKAIILFMEKTSCQVVNITLNKYTGFLSILQQVFSFFLQIVHRKIYRSLKRRAEALL